MNYKKIINSVPFKALLKKKFNRNDFIKKSLIYKLFFNILIQNRVKGYKKGPEIVLIENTNYCNAKCVICPHFSGINKAKGFMDFSLFTKIIDNMLDLKIKRLQITGTGEPLIDKNLVDKIKYAKKKGIDELNIFTNGSLLTEELAAEILDSGLDLICFSFDGIKKEEYEKIRIGLVYDNVLRNIRYFLKLREKKRKKEPYVIINSFVRDVNIDYFNSQILKDIYALVDKWNLYPVESETHKWGGAVEPINDNALDEEVINVPCRRLWATLNILWDGQVVPCCMDYEGDFALDDICEKKIQEIWQSHKFEEFREMHRKNRVSEILICSNCSERLSWFPQNCARLLDSII